MHPTALLVDHKAVLRITKVLKFQRTNGGMSFPRTKAQCPRPGLEPGPLAPGERTNQEATAPPVEEIEKENS